MHMPLQHLAGNSYSLQLQLQHMAAVTAARVLSYMQTSHALAPSLHLPQALSPSVTLMIVVHDQAGASTAA